MVEAGEVVGRFQSHTNTGVWVRPFITQLTGFTNAMLAVAPLALGMK